MLYIKYFLLELFFINPISLSYILCRLFFIYSLYKLFYFAYSTIVINFYLVFIKEFM